MRKGRADRKLVVGAAIVAALCVAGAACGKNTTPPDVGTSTATSGQAAAPITQIAPDLPPLPAAIVNAARPVEMTKAAYEFAARHPEVMNFIPCFCGCERPGLDHQGNHDCFVAARDDAGAVTAWEPHGLGCQVCIDVGFQARQMFAQGATVSEIRTAIDDAYAGAALHTPTPMPPSGGGHPDLP